jgi:glycine C-acetyltransferase
LSSDLPSFADFLFGDSGDPATPPPEFRTAMKEEAWARALYEPVLEQGPRPRTELVISDGRQAAINLASYDYLGMGQHPDVMTAAKAALEQYGTGACGSPMLCGFTPLHRQLEERLSAFLQRPSTMLFSSGYAGGFGTLGVLLRRNDVAVMDECAHVSLRDGATSARARIERFEHNRADALAEALARHPGKRRLVILEGIYSMDGDLADLPALLDAASAHGVSVLLDEAHSVLACGENGRGVAERQGCEARVTLYYGTLSKAFAGMGGFISGPHDTIDYVRFMARSYGFSCALPPPTVGGLLGALEVAEREGGKLRTQLQLNADYFRTRVRGLGFDTGNSTAQIVPIFWRGDRRGFYEVGATLRRRGLLLPGIDFPAVPADGLRFRASITAAHTRADLDEALNILSDTLR